MVRTATWMLLSFISLVACGDATPISTETAQTAQTATSTPDSTPATPVSDQPPATAPPVTPTTLPSTTTTASPYARPDWLGTRLLALRDDGFGEIQTTPPELQHRAFATLDVLPLPDSSSFSGSIEEVPPGVVARSTWHEVCPVELAGLRYVTVRHWGFDGQLHTGELIVNGEVAIDIVWVFEQLFDARFPIEQMRVIALEELDAPPTGDINDTTSFVCRPVVTSSGTWSQHAYGLAVDINPFHNPYQKGDLVLPELASYYLDRSLGEPGMIVDGDVVTQAFTEIGWGWGGNWNSLDDYMHFSQNGR